MNTVAFDIERLNLENNIEETTIDGRPLNCLIVQSLTYELKKELEKAIGRMDIKPYFTIRDIEARLNSGYFFSIGKIHGQIVGWTWAAIDDVYFGDFNCCIHIKNKEAFSYNTFVDKDFRGKRINQYMLKYLVNTLQEKGYKKIWGLIYPLNKSSIKSFIKSGWRVTENYRFLKLFGLNIHLVPKPKIL